MPAVIKYPSSVADQPDCRFCGQCGRRVQPMGATGKGFGACIDGADSVIECADFSRQIVNAYRIAEARGGDIHPETAALIARLGVPAAVVSEWLDAAKRVTAIKDYLRLGGYGMEGGALFMQALSEWVGEGVDAREKILALVEELKVHLDPTENGTRPLSYVEIADWFARVGKRADEILSDPGDWEMGDGEA